MVTDGVKRNPSPGDTQQALKITTACPSEGWGMRVVSVYGEKTEREGEDTRAGNQGKEGRESVSNSHLSSNTLTANSV